MRPYLGTARAYRWVIAAMLLIIWGAGLAAAVIEYRSTYQSEATIWAVRAAPALSVTDPDDPNVALIQTAAAQQAEVLKQLLQTRSFLIDVIGRTSLKSRFAASGDQDGFLNDIQRRFRVETLGTSLIRVSFASHDPTTPPELLNAALAVRAERIDQARQLSSAALGLLYERQVAFAQQEALDAQKALDDFNRTHPEPLSDPDQHVRAQLRLGVDFALVRLSDLRGRQERAALAPALLEVSGVEFQIVDQPRISTQPSGGERTAMTIATVAIAAGLGLAALLVLVGTLFGVPGARRARTAAREPIRADVIPASPSPGE
ncbi:MAG: hypothetical protein E6I57_00425 [Chloroflexi bacterium]|nr:MAG: hypothetical protein E6J49_03990 [Chloroflexota bacterium]TMB95074.1 MAG: hypothetical protein E6J38_06415 [Chloroflexota bacterium]TMC31095.1 MAG: hypothetical protein E6J27_01110 [Chloroflexota bacterium]TMC33286.1 MAG: hypothetical protein E6J24_10630 [Chloroflexota bacterium]TMC56239.1 MAG: hypothetical protein E6J19_09810 [Chloroflexota bacterium]